MGQISEPEQLEEGKYNIFLRGIQRYQIIEISQEAPYRVARVQFLEDEFPSYSDSEYFCEEIALNLWDLAPEIEFSLMEPDFVRGLDFATMINLICCCLDDSVYDKQRLLGTGDLGVRAQRVLEILDQKLRAKNLLCEFQALRPENPAWN